MAPMEVDVDSSGAEEAAKKLEQEVGGGVELLFSVLEMRKGPAVEAWLPRMLSGLLLLQVGM